MNTFMLEAFRRFSRTMPTDRALHLRTRAQALAFTIRSGPKIRVMPRYIERHDVSELRTAKRKHETLAEELGSSADLAANPGLVIFTSDIVSSWMAGTSPMTKKDKSGV